MLAVLRKRVEKIKKQNSESEELNEHIEQATKQVHVREMWHQLSLKDNGDSEVERLEMLLRLKTAIKTEQLKIKLRKNFFQDMRNLIMDE